MIGLKIPPKKANQLRLFLIENSLMHPHRRIKRSQHHIYLPLTKIPKKELMDHIESMGAQLVDIDFEEMEIRPRSMEDLLQGRLSPKQLDELKKSFDIIGETVILEIPPELEEYKYIIGEAALQFTKRRSVYHKVSEIKGVTRTRELEYLAGENNSQTIHREYGSQISLDIKKVYFSPRLATERRTITEKVQDGEIILDMFTGVGPFTINIARQHDVKIYATDINPQAIYYLEENLKLNKLKGQVIPILGDVREVLKKMDIKFDRIIMNLPGSAHEFLETAINYLNPGGIIHYYQFSQDFQDPINKIEKIAYPRQLQILEKRKVKSRSPGVWHLAVDVRLD